MNPGFAFHQIFTYFYPCYCRNCYTDYHSTKEEEDEEVRTFALQFQNDGCESWSLVSVMRFFFFLSLFFYPSVRADIKGLKGYGLGSSLYLC